MMVRYIFLFFMLLPSVAWASEAGGGGIHHATEFVLRRDGAWIVNFLFLFAGLFWLVKRVIIPFLNERSKQIAQSLEDAEASRMETMRKLSDMEYKAKQFEQEAARIRQESIQEGERLKQKMIEDGRMTAQSIIDKAKLEIENEIHKTRARLRTEAAEVAVKLASEIIAGKYGENDQRRMADEYIRHVEGKK